MNYDPNSDANKCLEKWNDYERNRDRPQERYVEREKETQRKYNEAMDRRIREQKRN